jgi:hypothetical protein
MAAAIASSSVGEPPPPPVPPPSFSDMLCYSQTVFAVLCAATLRVLYVSPNAKTVLGVEPSDVAGCVRRCSARASGGA